jgi:GNAT superfamily N-acetyltransferase
MTRSSAGSDQPAFTSGSVEIADRSYDHPDAVCLVRALYEEQVGRYGFADPIEADPATYRPPEGLFLVAYVRGEPCACAGYRPYDPVAAIVELKKMYTVPDLRNRGLGRLMLSRLEQRAVGRGARRAILETGARSHAALSLVRDAGYQPAPRYVSGRDPSINRAFVKDLSRLSTPFDLDGLRAIVQ